MIIPGQNEPIPQPRKKPSKSNAESEDVWHYSFGNNWTSVTKNDFTNKSSLVDNIKNAVAVKGVSKKNTPIDKAVFALLEEESKRRAAQNALPNPVTVERGSGKSTYQEGFTVPYPEKQVQVDVTKVPAGVKIPEKHNQRVIYSTPALDNILDNYEIALSKDSHRKLTILLSAAEQYKRNGVQTWMDSPTGTV